MVNAEFAYLEKNKHYASYLEEHYPRCRNFILATGGQKGTYDDFVLLTWADVCVRIRQWVAERAQKEIGCAMLLLFCAIVEQQLNALKTGSATQIAYIEHMDYMKDN